MFYLLDINALIALADARSRFRPPARKWLQDRGLPAIATCPLTENGFLRVFGNPNYPDGPGSVDAARRPLEIIKNREKCMFIPDDLSVLNKKLGIDLTDCTSKQLTDLYLLALAKQHGGKFATFDARVPARYVRGGSSALEIIPT